MTDPLRLKVSSGEDLQVLSALLQDAIIPGEDMVFARADQRFILVANRFCWDQPAEDGLVSESGAPVFQRQLCGVQFHGVSRVQTSGLPADRKAALLNLLAITTVDGGIGPNTLAKVEEYVRENGEHETVKKYQEMRQKYYEQLSTFATFGRGWTRRVEETTKLALDII